MSLFRQTGINEIPNNNTQPLFIVPYKSQTIKATKNTINQNTLNQKKQNSFLEYRNQNHKTSMFLPTSRLNRGQRKYCHCLMQVRTLKKQPYAICKNMSYHVMKSNPNQVGLRFNPKHTNCIMNYDYTKYSFNDIKALAKERGIPLTNKKTGRVNNKTTLVQQLTKHYVTNHAHRVKPI